MMKTMLWGIPAHLLGLIGFALLVLVYLAISFVRSLEAMIERE